LETIQMSIKSKSGEINCSVFSQWNCIQHWEWIIYNDRQHRWTSQAYVKWKAADTDEYCVEKDCIGQGLITFHLYEVHKQENLSVMSDVRTVSPLGWLEDASYTGVSKSWHFMELYACDLLHVCYILESVW
jgi:hypothetical protein